MDVHVYDAALCSCWMGSIVVFLAPAIPAMQVQHVVMPPLGQRASCIKLSASFACFMRLPVMVNCTGLGSVSMSDFCICILQFP